MTHQESASVVSARLAEVEAQLRDVESWPHFLVGLESVTKTAHERYRFSVRQGSGVHDVDVAVLCHPREHHFVWHALSGPAWDGDIRLVAVDDRRTRVTLSITVDPRGFAADMADMLGTSGSAAALDLQRLEQLVRR